jgi:hypothetical protein
MSKLRMRRRAGVVVAATAAVVGALGGGLAAGAADCPTPPASQRRPWLDPSYRLVIGSSSRDLRSRAWLYVGRPSVRSG